MLVSTIQITTEMIGLCMSMRRRVTQHREQTQCNVSVMHYIQGERKTDHTPLNTNMNTPYTDLYTDIQSVCGVVVALTPQSSPRVQQVSGSECPYIPLSSSWGPETHMNTSDTQSITHLSNLFKVCTTLYRSYLTGGHMRRYAASQKQLPW